MITNSQLLQNQSVTLNPNNLAAVDCFRQSINRHLGKVAEGFTQLWWMHGQWEEMEEGLKTKQQDINGCECNLNLIPIFFALTNRMMIITVTAQLSHVYEDLDQAHKQQFVLQTENTTLCNATTRLPPPADYSSHQSPPAASTHQPPSPISAPRPVKSNRSPSVAPSMPLSVANASTGLTNLAGRSAQGRKGQSDLEKEAVSAYKAATRIHVGTPLAGNAKLVRSHGAIEYLANGWPSSGPGWLGGRFAYQPDDPVLITKGIIEKLKSMVLGVVRKGASNLAPPPDFVSFNPSSATGPEWDVVKLKKDGFWLSDPGLKGKTSLGKLFANKLGQQPSKEKIGPLTDRLRKLLMPLVAPGGWERRDKSHDSFIVSTLPTFTPTLVITPLVATAKRCWLTGDSSSNTPTRRRQCPGRRSLLRRWRVSKQRSQPPQSARRPPQESNPASGTLNRPDRLCL